MGRTAGYKTKQREYILEYLRSCGTRHTTVGEIVRHLQDSGTPVGTATVYRHLEQLVEDGAVRKYVLDEKCGRAISFCRNRRRRAMSISPEVHLLRQIVPRELYVSGSAEPASAGTPWIHRGSHQDGSLRGVRRLCRNAREALSGCLFEQRHMARKDGR